MESAEQSIKEALAPLIEAVRAGNYDVAIAGLKAILQAHPGHEIATGLLAASYFQIGLRDQARVLYEQLVAEHPANALARFQLGLLRSSDDPRAALSIWEPLLEADEEFMAHFHSALAHIQLGDPAAAEALLEHAARYMPASHPLREQLNQLRESLAHGGNGSRNAQ